MIQQHIAALKNEIAELEQRYSREKNSVTWVAVTKQQSIESIQAAIDAGQFAFAENYLQEALPKIAALSDPRLIWHFIGSIQRNKTQKIAEQFAWVQSVASFMMAKRLNDQRPDYLPVLNICLQVNISGETSKAGALPSDVFTLAESCVALPRLRLRGLMAIPARKVDQDFIKMREIFNALKQKYSFVDTLSMGMSDDMAQAIAAGSTMVRIGTRIFGARG